MVGKTDSYLRYGKIKAPTALLVTGRAPLVFCSGRGDPIDPTRPGDELNVLICKIKSRYCVNTVAVSESGRERTCPLHGAP